MLTPLLDQLLLDSQMLLLTRILQNAMQRIRQNNVALIMTFEILFAQPTSLYSILRKKLKPSLSGQNLTRVPVREISLS